MYHLRIKEKKSQLCVNLERLTALSSYAVTFTCVWPGHQNKEQRSSDYKTNKVSVISFTAQDAIPPRYLT